MVITCLMLCFAYREVVTFAACIVTVPAFSRENKLLTVSKQEWLLCAI